MKIIIKGRQIQLDPASVKIAKTIVGNLLTQVNDISLKHNTPELYITMLAVMNLMSQNSLELIDEEKLEIAMQNVYNTKI